jgi:hypothetical protein
LEYDNRKLSTLFIIKGDCFMQKRKQADPKEHYGPEKSVGECDVWTEEDLRDLTAAVLQYADYSHG